MGLHTVSLRETLGAKFNKNRSKGSSDMERTQNGRVIPMILKVDLDLDCAKLNHGFGTTFN